MQVQPYLFFEGRCEEALKFYESAIGARITALMRFKDAPPEPQQASQEGCGPGAADPEKIMHANLQIGDSQIMASDGMSSGTAAFKGISLSINASSDAEADRIFAALSQGGQVQMPMGATFFASRFGVLADKFGVSWMIIVPLPDMA